MEKFEEKIIDLVDVIAEPEGDHLPEKAPKKDLKETTEIKTYSPTEEKSTPPSAPEQADFEKLVHMEVEQNLRSMVEEHFKNQSGFDQKIKQEIEQSLRLRIGEHIEGMIKEIMTQEIQKAIAREIEGLKKSK